MKIIKEVLYTIIVTVLVLILGVVLLSSFGKYKLLMVSSDSMAPTIKVGSIIFIKPETNYQKGDIVTIRINDKMYLTHRIYDFEENKGETLLITKGDANNGTDTKLSSEKNILGRVFITIPLLGYFVVFVKSLPGLILFIIIPGLLLIWLEIKKLLKK
jgi:signal peptidase